MNFRNWLWYYVRDHNYSLLLADQVVDAKSLTEILTPYSRYWKQIGLELGLNASVLDNIEDDVSKQRDRFERTLEDWLKLDQQGATWGVLELAITNANRQYLQLPPLSKCKLKSSELECMHKI